MMVLLFSVLLALLPENNPWRLSPEQAQIAGVIVQESVEAGLDPFHMLAIGWTESNFRPNLVSRTGDYGVMQVNCRLWYKKLGLSSRKECRQRMRDVRFNVQSAIFVVERHNKYRQCRGKGIFRCYNGGPWWHKSKFRERVLRYDKRAKNVLYRLVYNYKDWIGGMVKGLLADNYKSGSGSSGASPPR